MVCFWGFKRFYYYVTGTYSQGSIIRLTVPEFANLFAFFTVFKGCNILAFFVVYLPAFRWAIRGDGIPFHSSFLLFDCLMVITAIKIMIPMVIKIGSIRLKIMFKLFNHVPAIKDHLFRYTRVFTFYLFFNFASFVITDIKLLSYFL